MSSVQRAVCSMQYAVCSMQFTVCSICLLLVHTVLLATCYLLHLLIMLHPMSRSASPKKAAPLQSRAAEVIPTRPPARSYVFSTNHMYSYVIICTQMYSDVLRCKHMYLAQLTLPIRRNSINVQKKASNTIPRYVTCILSSSLPRPLT